MKSLKMKVGGGDAGKYAGVAITVICIIALIVLIVIKVEGFNQQNENYKLKA
jgi:hypothetical protein